MNHFNWILENTKNYSFNKVMLLLILYHKACHIPYTECGKRLATGSLITTVKELSEFLAGYTKGIIINSLARLLMDEWIRVEFTGKKERITFIKQGIINLINQEPGVQYE